MQGVHARARYVIATLVDLRSSEHRQRLADGASRLGCEIEVVALSTGSVGLPDGLTVSASAFATAQPLPVPVVEPPRGDRVVEVPRRWPDGVREGGDNTAVEQRVRSEVLALTKRFPIYG